MARITGLNQCSPLLLFGLGPACFSARFDLCSGFLAHVVVLLHAKSLGRKANGLHALCLQCHPCLCLWNPACTPWNVNQCEK